MRFLATIGWSGSNVTHPFKQLVMACCDETSDHASALGAVNTLTFDHGRIRGDNTDWIGFSDLIERQIGDVSGQAIAQVGAGGVGSATAYALARLAPLFPLCRFVIAASARQAIAGRQGIVQTTPVGMATHPGTPFSPDAMSSDQWLADVIYFSAETELLAAARAKGMKAVNGAAMVVGQAGEAFRLFTGQKPYTERMLASLLPNASCGAIK